MGTSSGTPGARIRVVEGLDALAALVGGADRPLYLRHSRGPDADAAETSRDYESGLALPGLSATVLTPQPWWTRPLADWLARQICTYVELTDAADDRAAWVLSGRVVGRGPDHEPLLADAVPVARLSRAAVDQARDRYAARFDVGRGSAD
ncbi:MAG TPA: DUF6098 family protein [Thermobifida alba]|nr:DUF6098 family protein [Thermobifida alba]